jgi:glycine cleavage system aminomethyltransferase T
LRHDLFFHKKSVHVKLTKEVHTSLREKLFRHGITMQDLFQEAAEMILMEGPKSEKLLEKISKKKLLASVEKINRSQSMQLGELDSDTLYNLLEDSDDDETTAE